MDNNMDVYRKKYLKYKNKYINLKNQIGYSGGSSSSQPIIQTTSLVLPCEITNYTSKLYISNQPDRNDLSSYLHDLSNREGVLVGHQIGIVRVNAAFAQDSYIFLKDTSDTNDNTSNYVIPGRSELGPFVGPEITKHTDCSSHLRDDNQLGGNFISSPDNTVFTFDNSDFSNCLNKKLGGDKVVSLNCSFKAFGIRHIDETMCFMPYGRGEYKVWIYKFRNIEYTDEFHKSFKKSERTRRFINNMESRVEFLTQYTKMEADALDIVTKQRDKRAKRAEDIRKIRAEGHTPFMTTLNFVEKSVDEEIKTYIYNRNDLQNLYPTIDTSKVLDAVKYNNRVSYDLSGKEIEDGLKKEKLVNLDIISNKLFGGRYLNYSHNFVEFPIDLKVGIDKVKGVPSYKITNIPIFNRLIIETKDVKKCIFSIGMAIDNEVKAIVDQQKEYIKSFIEDDKPFDIHYYNTHKFNDDSSGDTGGNLHCLVKNQYGPPPKLD